MRTHLGNKALLQILVYCFLSNAISFGTKDYMMGFYIGFLEERKLDTTIGMTCISVTLVTSIIGPYLYRWFPAKFTKIVPFKRCSILILFNGCFIALMGLIDPLVEKYPSGEIVFAWIFLLRALQGVTSALINIMVQGEMVDYYFTAHKMFTVVISSSMHLGIIITSVLTAELYVVGGWSLACPAVGTTSIAPLLLLPFISRAESGIGGEAGNGERERLLKQEETIEERSEPEENRVEGNCKRTDENRGKCKMSWVQIIAFYLPDAAVFINNFMYNLMMFSLPARLVKFSDGNISSVVLVTNLINAFSLIFALIQGYLAEKALDIFKIMIFGNLSFYIGCLFAFGSTTTFLQFPLKFELGSLLMGMGDPCIVNLVFMSKFVMYERWMMTTTDLGARTATINNFVFNISCLLGTVASSVSVSRQSEFLVFCANIAAYAVSTISLIAASLVK